MTTDERREELVRAARTTLGDRVRSVTYFTREEFDQLYLREDLAAEADLVGFVEEARRGFTRPTHRNTELGDYRYTVRAFEEGRLLRTTGADEGVFVTVEAVSFRRAEETAAALHGVLDGE